MARLITGDAERKALTSLKYRGLVSKPAIMDAMVQEHDPAGRRAPHGPSQKKAQRQALG